MAAVSLIDQLKTNNDYLAQMVALIASDYKNRAEGKGPAYDAKEIADNLKENAHKAIDTLIDSFNQLHFKDFKRDKSGDVAYFASIQPGLYARIKNASTKDLISESKVVAIVGRGDGEKAIVVEALGSSPFGEVVPSMGISHVWNDDIGGWQKSALSGIYLDRLNNDKILTRPDINSTIYTIEFSATPSPELQQVRHNQAAEVDRGFNDRRGVELAERMASLPHIPPELRAILLLQSRGLPGIQ